MTNSDWLVVVIKNGKAFVNNQRVTIVDADRDLKILPISPIDALDNADVIESVIENDSYYRNAVP